MRLAITSIHFEILLAFKMELFENLKHLSKRGLLNVPTPELRYKIVQFPAGFVKVEDTERIFCISENGARVRKGKYY